MLIGEEDSMEQMIEGQVRTTAGRVVTGVCISNGREIVRTDLAGQYRLPHQPEDRFVYVTVPAGCRAVGQFYIDLEEAEAFDFLLEPHPASADSTFSFVQITDMHISVTRRAFAHHLEEDLAQIHREVGAQARFIVASGDLTAGGQRAEYAAYLRAIAASPLPVYHAAGNHDDDAELQGNNFMDYLGPLYYSFDYGPLHFVVYDGEGSTRHEEYHQDTWLHADLTLQPPNRPVVIINHFPWGSEFYDRWKHYPVIATLSGHWHSSRFYVDGSIVHYNTPSLGFGGIDQSPRAYRLFTYADGKLKAETRALVPPAIFPGITFRPQPDHSASDIKRFAGAAPTPNTDWPLFHGNACRTGAVPDGPQPPLSLAWRTPTGGGIHMASPVIAEDMVFQATKNEDELTGNGLIALDARYGTPCWHHTSNTAIKRAPAYSEGCLFAATVTGEILALTAADGQILWTYQLGDPSQRWVYSSPLICAGCLYVGVSSHFVALEVESGAVIWRREDLGPNDWISSYASPAWHDKYIVVAFYTQPTNLAVLEAATGKTVWAKAEGKPYHMYATPVIDERGSVYTVSGGMVRAFSLETGQLQWETSLTLQRIHATPALAGNRLFVATGVGVLHALDTTDGTELWQWNAGEGHALFSPYVREGQVTLTSPVVADGYVYVGGADGYLYALAAATGACAWQHNLAVPLAGAPALSGSGLWIGGSDGCVYAFSETGT